ncbi:hypothetical protein PO883_01620 [Massilia sp. DJPM01]|uniref:hypothetical protein n=1 Tax=Massilia sp. DJPM01 TaxID=3024404 RepID=UPI00259E9FBA|nr:hypothetical protein [Massilia sp. DJPM01]MDM5175896.1 hypothetical protein [Massilia sp. DJPM01]
MARLDLSWFDSPEDEAQLRRLDELVEGLSFLRPTQPDFKELLSVFERFPCHDGFGVFWAIVHCIENSQGYEPALLESVRRTPCDFNLTMINRMLNGGITNVGHESLIELLHTVAASENASEAAREAAKHFIAYQSAKL